jgi:GMP synthase (glutamine-hydrolysing)
MCNRYSTEEAFNRYAMTYHMRQLLVVKVGSTLGTLLYKRGDFEDWILSGMGVARELASIIEVSKGEVLPNFEAVSGVVITGSHAMVTERRDWSEYTAKWLLGAVDRQIPILGICYGHQLLAHALGGEVSNNPHGLEFGTVEVRLNGSAENDALLKGLGNPIHVHACHTQSVLKLPAGAEALASSHLDPHQAFRLGERIWGIQFHPEFDAEIVAEYIHNCRQLLLEEGIDPDVSLNSVVDTDYGARILTRFYRLINQV